MLCFNIVENNFRLLIKIMIQEVIQKLVVRECIMVVVDDMLIAMQ